MGPALVILAAGASSRLGECKALASIGGRTALEHLLAAAEGVFEGPAVVVTGAHHAEIQGSVLDLADAVEVRHNPDWSAGRLGGLRLGWEARRGRDLCLAPVDCPLVPARVFEELARAWLAEGSPPRGWLAPRHGTGSAARHGHPLFLGRELEGELAGWAPDRSLRELRRIAGPVLGHPVEAPEVLFDLDTPSDLAALRAHEARS